jgi:hypothetical protein
MAGILSTINLKDANGTPFTQRVWDESGSGSGPFQVITYNPLTPLGYSKITSLASAVGLGSGTLGAIPSGAVNVTISCSSGNVRWCDDGTNPTATRGMPLLDGQTIQYVGTLSAFLVIASNLSPTFDISFYK